MISCPYHNRELLISVTAFDNPFWTFFDNLELCVLDRIWVLPLNLVIQAKCVYMLWQFVWAWFWIQSTFVIGFACQGHLISYIKCACLVCTVSQADQSKPGRAPSWKATFMTYIPREPNINSSLVMYKNLDDFYLDRIIYQQSNQQFMEKSNLFHWDKAFNM